LDATVTVSETPIGVILLLSLTGWLIVAAFVLAACSAAAESETPLRAIDIPPARMPDRAA
jgi:hypothetical protein